MELGLGTSTIRSLGRRASQAEVDRLVGRALALGVRIFDTADSYGAGSAERALGRALARAGQQGARPARVISKAGARFVDLPGPLRVLNQPAKKLLHGLGLRHAFEADRLPRLLAGSLARLRVDRLYAYLLHDPPRSVLASPALPGLLAVLRDSGAVERVGISTDWDSLALLEPVLPAIGLLQVPAPLYLEKTAFFRRAAAEHGIEVVVNQVSRIAESVPAGVARLAALDAPPAVVLIGTRNVAHLEENLRAMREAAR